MRGAVILTMAAAALAGCSGKGANSGAPTHPGGQAAGDDSQAVAGPMRRAGLWTITHMRDGKPSGGAIRLCIDAATDARMGVLTGGVARGVCTDQKSQRNADGSWSFSSTCQLALVGTTQTQGTARGDFATHYEVHSQSDTTNAQIASLNGRHVSDLSATYGGACPADMQPGDVLLSNGMKLNPEKMMAGTHTPMPGADH